MKKSEKLYSSSIVVESISILLALASVSLPLNIYFTYIPHLNPFLLLAATMIFLTGILCMTFGHSAEKSESWFHNCSLVFSAYEKSKARVT